MRSGFGYSSASARTWLVMVGYGKLKVTGRNWSGARVIAKSPKLSVASCLMAGSNGSIVVCFRVAICRYSQCTHNACTFLCHINMDVIDKHTVCQEYEETNGFDGGGGSQQKSR